MKATTRKSRSNLKVTPIMVCVKCRRRLICSCSGVWAQENMEKGGKPRRLAMFDLWKCTECGYEILAGAGTPIYPYEREEFERYQGQPEIEFW